MAGINFTVRGLMGYGVRMALPPTIVRAHSMRRNWAAPAAMPAWAFQVEVGRHAFVALCGAWRHGKRKGLAYLAVVRARELG